MIKYFFLLLNLVGFLLFGLFQNNETKVEINAPVEITAGHSFVVEVKITKGDISGLGRFVQELPVGLTAAHDETSMLANADFKFKYQSVKLMWFLLPADNEIIVKYNIYVDPTFTGDITLGGEFVFLKESTKETVTANPFVIKVNEGDGTLAESIPVNENDDMEISPLKAAKVICTRETPYFTDDNSIIVNIEIEKGSGNNYAKIEEMIPAGYTATSLENKDAIFITENNIIKFTWMNLPIDNKFVVSYKLTSNNNSTAVPNITGVFSFLENDKNREERIVQSNYLPNPDMIAANVPKKASKQTENQENQGEEIVEVKKVDNIVEKNNDSKQEKTNKEIASKNRDQENTSIESSNPEGLKYRVQLAAGHKRVKADRYFKKLKIDEKVDIEMHDGWHKYLVGSHSNYKDARNHRVRIWDATPIDDAFVSAYNNGSRITVQEALMIGNQKWVK